jgi:osmotically inducible lipoprotein OsmB
MRIALKVGMLALMLAAVPLAVQAGVLEGAAIGAGTGAVVAGPVGAVVGGAVGAVVGGPNIVNRRYRHADNYRSCWLDRRGYRHCTWR